MTGRESGRRELLAVCGLQRPADDRATRARHPDAIVLDTGVEFTAAAMLLEEGVEVGEECHPPSLAHPRLG